MFEKCLPSTQMQDLPGLFENKPYYLSRVNAAENRVRLRIEGKLFVGWEKLNLKLSQKEKYSRLFWPLASMTYLIPQFIQSILNIVVCSRLGNSLIASK
ncbi:hypothetical protein TNCV_517551 [Trichonephila clavipes]|nr:hypothetical protein TNCV_517551 [Trichonephila clavipes]